MITMMIMIMIKMIIIIILNTDNNDTGKLPRAVVDLLCLMTNALNHFIYAETKC